MKEECHTLLPTKVLLLESCARSRLSFQVNCDLPYWFDVVVVANSSIYLAVESNFNVFCKDNTIFVRINGDQVSSHLASVLVCLF